ncbi:MAG: hypothetical protein WA071_16590 [Undibacterium umbellatum]|uniref:hypothetical protein n=1 Tax=Undibacterium umbellatum TaxID=2762300 RepID=UPI003BB5430A
MEILACLCLIPYAIPFGIAFMMPNRRVLLIVVTVISALLIWQLVTGLTPLFNSDMTGGEGDGSDAESTIFFILLLYGFPCAGLWAGAVSRWFLWRQNIAAENQVVCAAIALSGFLAMPLLFFLWILTRH